MPQYDELRNFFPEDEVETMAKNMESSMNKSYLSGGKTAMKEIGIKGTFRTIDRASLAFFRNYSLMFSTKEAATTVDNMKSIIFSGLKEGRDIDTIARQLRTTGLSPYTKILPKTEAELKKIVNYRSKMIARTETMRASNMGRMYSYKAHGVEHVKWLVGLKPCPECTDYEGRVFRIDEAIVPPLHPNSVARGTSLVYTPKGIKKIRDIRVGDEIFTHKGRFKKVLNVLKIFQKERCLINIRVSNFHLNNRLLLTDEHRVLTKKGWIETKNLNLGDEIISYLKPCSECQTLHSLIKNHCSNKCQRLSKAKEFARQGTSALKALTPLQRLYNNRKKNKIQKLKGNLGFQITEVQQKAQERLDEIAKTLGMRPNCLNILFNHSKSFIETSFPITKINKRRIHKQVLTYDIQVEDDETFVCEGLVIHNCTCTLAATTVTPKAEGQKEYSVSDSNIKDYHNKAWAATKTDGNEHMIFFNKKKPLMVTGTRDSIPTHIYSPAAAMRTGNYGTIHTHPGWGGPPSSSDMHVFLFRKNIRYMGVRSKNFYYEMVKTEGTKSRGIVARKAFNYYNRNLTEKTLAGHTTAWEKTCEHYKINIKVTEVG